MNVQLNDFKELLEVASNEKERALILQLVTYTQAETLKLYEQELLNSVSYKKRGQYFAFAIVLIFAALGTYLALIGKELAGGILGSTGILGVVTVFITGQTSQIRKKK